MRTDLEPRSTTTTDGALARALGLSPRQALAAWSAVHAVAYADDVTGAASRRLSSLAAAALGVAPDPAPAAGDLAAAFPDPKQRRTLVDALVIAACIEGEVTLAREREVQTLARHLGVRSHWAALLPALRLRRTFAVKRALATRSPDARRIFSRIWQEEGVLGLLRAVVFVLGLSRDAALAARFHALAHAPGGSFGHAVSEHFRARGLAYPGEKNGLPERMMHHDLMHVLNGYDTDPAGECQLAAFYAGFADGDAFTFFVTVLATFHLGLTVSPSIVTPARGAFDPERALAAFLRGRLVHVDVMGAWDYWKLMPLALDEARATIGIDVPRLEPS